MKRLAYLIVVGMLGVASLGCVVSHTSKVDNTKSEAAERHYVQKWEKEIGYAQVVQVGQTLYVSGIPAGGKDMNEAVNKAYIRITDLLAKFGATPDDIVKEVLYTVDMEAMKKVQDVRRGYFSEGVYPAATWIQVDRFYIPGLLLEVDVTVHLAN